MTTSSISILRILSEAALASKNAFTEPAIWNDFRTRLAEPLMQLQAVARRGALGVEDTDILRSAPTDLAVYEANAHRFGGNNYNTISTPDGV